MTSEYRPHARSLALYEYLLMDSDVPMETIGMEPLEGGAVEAILEVGEVDDPGDLLYGPSTTFKITITPIDED